MQAEQQALAGAHRQQMQVVKWALGALSDYSGNLASSWKKVLVGKRLGTRSKRPDDSSSEMMMVTGSWSQFRHREPSFLKQEAGCCGSKELACGGRLVSGWLGTRFARPPS